MAPSPRVVEMDQAEAQTQTNLIDNTIDDVRDGQVSEFGRRNLYHTPTTDLPDNDERALPQNQFSHYGGGLQHNFVGSHFSGNVYFGGVSASLFSSLIDNIDPLSETEQRILRLKKQIEHGRNPLQLPEHPNCYSPYAVVRNSKIKGELRQTATHCEFLDSCFAEYFRAAVPSFGQAYARELLADARNILAKSQSQSQGWLNESEHIYLGDLGHFCEEVAESWNQPNMNPKFTVRHQSDTETWHYLQDAFEVPYWKFMLRLFNGWRERTKSPSGEVVSRVLQSVKLDLLDGRHRLLHELKMQKDADEEDIAPILEGIDARIRALESLCFDKTLGFDKKHGPKALSFEDSRVSGTKTIEELTGQLPNEMGSKSKETATLITLILVFLILAIIPGYKGFSISMKSRDPGSTEDADFWYLVQNSIMAVLGNIIMVVPLLGKSWFSPAYNYMWLFFGLGFAFAATSVIIYPFFNTGWSSMISFLGSICSVASVLVMTQATANGAKGASSKVKAKAD